MPQHKNVVPDIGFAGRLRAMRRDQQLTIRELAAKIGCDRGYLSRLEAAKSINPAVDLIRRAAAVLGVNEHWLETGIGDPFEGPAADSVGADIQFNAAFAAIAEQLTFEQMLSCVNAITQGAAFTPAARTFWLKMFAPWLAIRAQHDNENARNMLTNDKALLDTTKVTDKRRSYWTELRERLRFVTAAHGQRAEVARRMTVTPQAVTEWLSGASAPTADTTLRLAEWVSAEEAKQKRAGSAVTQPARKTRRSKSTSHEKAKSDQIKS